MRSSLNIETSASLTGLYEYPTTCELTRFLNKSMPINNFKVPSTEGRKSFPAFPISSS